MAIPLERISGKYEILEKLREGGMGAIYKVRHRLLEEIRVVKVMRPDIDKDETFQQRFLNEARTAIKLRHRNLAMLYDCTVDDDGNAFMAMEYIDGVTLRDVIDRSGPPSMGMILEVAHQALEAITYLHHMGIVHRDISPDNLMLSKDDEGRPTVKLIDLGIAKVKSEDSGLTETGTFVGKFKYCAPEQFGAGGSKAADERCDLYSFGVVLYELMTGRHPIPGNEPASVIAAHLYSPPLPFEESDPRETVPSKVRALIMRALEKKPEQRYESARVFMSEVEEASASCDWQVDEFERVVRDVMAFQDGGETPRHGSTQDRLDRSFGLGNTPHPDDGTTRGSAEGERRRFGVIEGRREDTTPSGRSDYMMGERTTEAGGYVVQPPPDVQPETEEDATHKLMRKGPTTIPFKAVAKEPDLEVDRNARSNFLLPSFRHPLCWTADEYPFLENDSPPSLESHRADCLSLPVNFRGSKIGDGLSVALLELFMALNVVTLDSAVGWVDLKTRLERSGVLAGTVCFKPIDSSGKRPSRDLQNKIRSELNRLIIRSVRRLKAGFLPAASCVLRVSKRTISFRRHSGGRPVHTCGWMVPRAGGRFQQVELYMRSSKQPLHEVAEGISDGAGIIALESEGDVFLMAIDLPKVLKIWSG